ncbi:HD domain-containing protein [Psychrobacter sp. I-STPA10]|uniref:HD domain-containing protein n=1 Tax=Psychrobacter sp. I-STPA10 TaxID=2585769 RepID=UPI001E439BA8|nr:HD domain-containing protein [Psychrobacter sp. I-STPA10]
MPSISMNSDVDNTVASFSETAVEGTTENVVESMDTMQDITQFLLQLDALKHIERRSYITGGSRLENSAEHSWHLAMAAWAIATYFELPLNHERLLKMALVHDLGEIDAGDTFLYAPQRSEAHLAERQGMQRLQNHAGHGISDLVAIWEAQETGASSEAKLIKVVDRLLPFLLNINTKGRTWQDLGVSRSQVAAAHAFIANEFPIIHHWIYVQIEHATKMGWLIDE